MPMSTKNGNRSRKRQAYNSELARATRILRRHLPELREQYHVKSLGIFGSYARGEQRRRSDLDVLVEFDRPPSLNLCTSSAT